MITTCFWIPLKSFIRSRHLQLGDLWIHVVIRKSCAFRDCPTAVVTANMAYVTYLGLSDAERVEELRVLDGQFNDLFDLFDLLVETADHVVGRVRHLLDHHQTDERVHLVTTPRDSIV